MKTAIAPVAALLLSVAMLLMGNGLQGTLLPVRGSLETFSNMQIGVLGAFYYIGFTLGCLAGPALIARAGHIRAYLALVSVSSTVALVHVIVVDPVAWWVLRAITGFCLSVLYVVIESWLNERSTNETRGSIFAVYTVIQLTVITVGQMMMTMSDPKAFPLFALVSILMSLAAVPVAMTRAQSPNPIPLVFPNLRQLFRSAPVAFVGCFSVGLTNGAFWSLGPVFALSSGLDTTGIGLFMSMVVLGGAVGQWPFGRLSDKVDRRSVVLGICVSAVVASLALSYATKGSEVSVFVTAFVLGLFAFPLYSVSVAHANDKAEENAYVETSSGLLLVLGIGSVMGPILASFVDEYVAKQSLFIYTAGIYALTSVFVIARMFIRGATVEAEKVEFKDALIASKVLAPLDVTDPEDVRE